MFLEFNSKYFLSYTILWHIFKLSNHLKKIYLFTCSCAVLLNGNIKSCYESCQFFDRCWDLWFCFVLCLWIHTVTTDRGTYSDFMAESKFQPRPHSLLTYTGDCETSFNLKISIHFKARYWIRENEVVMQMLL